MSRRRRKDKGERKREPDPRSPTDLLRDALTEISEGKEEVDRRYRSKQRHVDDYRELVIKRSERENLSDALMKLTQETHSNRQRLLPEEEPSVKLSGGIKGQGGRKEAQQTAAEAAKEYREDLRKHGIRERTHYYPATERQQTGEVDRTYDVPPPKSKKRDDRRAR